MADMTTKKTVEVSHEATVHIEDDKAYLTIASTNEKGSTSFMGYIVQAFEPEHARYSLSTFITFQKRVTRKAQNCVKKQIQYRFISFTEQNLEIKFKSTQIIPENQKTLVKLHTERAIQMLEDQAPRDEGAETDIEYI